MISSGKIYDSNGKAIGDKAVSFDDALDSKVLSEVKKGNNLKLTVDMDLQYGVEKIIEEELIQKKTFENTDLLDRAFVVMMDPNTGEILTMAGKQYVRDEETGKMQIHDFALGNITTSYTMGTVITGATILTGYETGAIQPGQVILDTPLKIKGTVSKKSWKDMGFINDLNALKQSSDVYMYNTAIRIGEGEYRENQPLKVNPEAFDTMRRYMGQFGLGVATGVDLSDEMKGFKGKGTEPGKLLDLSIGQYDTYTPMQLLQYASTIANGGKRLQPHILKEIREPAKDASSLGAIIKEVSPTILNKVDMEPKMVERVQKGFQKVMQEEGGTGYSMFGNAGYNPAGKTGAASAFYDGPLHKNNDEPLATMNLSLVSYAPANNPEVAVAVVVPWAYQGESGHSMNLDIGRKVMDKYFELKGNSKAPLSEGEEKNADVKE
ncbi:penicillin-binding transpeptidase domain-containing protein [Bacillus massiliigorillae]|uniref:penicillin-binding transpeptidase domain-containing protein n=1 Tax=Bacillus massiliigorillae TaxID=1243664 RepID=UPI0003A3AECE|nr:penicillin-binding transpeptidase domain-containing protein [Bacillus massiliigorillae]